MNEKLPSTIREINSLPEPEKIAIYHQLIPQWVIDRFNLDPLTLKKDGMEDIVRMRCPSGSRAMEIGVYPDPNSPDPALYLNMVDTFNNQLMVLLVVINDHEGPRFNVDVDLDGNDTQFGTQTRNIPEEIRAMEAGLAPGQVRRGLRSFRSGIPIFENFVARMGHELFLIEPMSYHNAVIFERYGFAYTYGRREMEKIDQEFHPGGELYVRLDGSTPFRQRDAWKTIRGRSWAIHDGILGHPFTGFQMYKHVEEDASVTTFSDAHW